MKTEMINRPRASGKSVLLRLKFHELIAEKCYDVVIVKGHCKGESLRLKRYCQKYHENVQLSIEKESLVCMQEILVLIDEPFILDKNEQNHLITQLNELEKNIPCDIHIIGIGTLVEEKNDVTFKDFI